MPSFLALPQSGLYQDFPVSTLKGQVSALCKQKISPQRVVEKKDGHMSDTNVKKNSDLNTCITDSRPDASYSMHKWLNRSNKPHDQLKIPVYDIWFIHLYRGPWVLEPLEGREERRRGGEWKEMGDEYSL